MSLNEPTITVHGNLAADPELHYFPSGANVCEFTVIQNPRFRGTDGSWTDGEPISLRVKAWRHLGENVAETLTKGHRVTVVGRLRRRPWQTDDGERRFRDEIEADDVSLSLGRQRAKVIRMARDAETDTTPSETADTSNDG